MQKFEGKYFRFYGINIAQILTEYVDLLFLYKNLKLSVLSVCNQSWYTHSYIKTNYLVKI